MVVMEERHRSTDPWFRRRPGSAVAVASVLLVGVTALRFSSGDEREATSLLFALPVTLLALAFGAVVGTVAALVCVGILAVWVFVAGADLSLLAWVSRAVPLLLLGFLVGRATDELAQAEALRVSLAVADVRRRDAAEIHDGVLQRIAAAKWLVEAGQSSEAVDAMEEALTIGEALVAHLLTGVDKEERTRARRPG